MYDRVFLFQGHSFRVCIRFGNFYFKKIKYGPIHDVLKGGISFLGTSPRSFPGNARTHQPEQEPTHQCASFVNLLANVSLLNLSQLSFCFIYVDVTDCRWSQCKSFVCLWHTSRSSTVFGEKRKAVSFFYKRMNYCFWRNNSMTHL